MGTDYWVEHITGKLYAVKWHGGSSTITMYEGTEDECYLWIRKNQKQ